ncbi:MAG: signal peptidase I [Anaeroplasmataceae bacterium]|nr:signal peptidase I [Anaeroplasmataceae bacterium]
MTKKEKKQLKEAIANEEYIDQNNELIFKKLIFNPLLRAGGLLILLIFSLINNERIKRLASLTSNAFFNSEHILGYRTYYTILGITIGLCFIVSLLSLIAKSNINLSSIKILRNAYQIYSIYDLVIFIFSTFVCLFFIIMILITPCNISGTSMHNTYEDGDRVLLWNIGYSPVNKDVIVFDSSKYAPITNQQLYDWETKKLHTDYTSSSSERESRFYIKRIIAKEKDEIRYDALSHSLYVNEEFVENLNSFEMSRLLYSLKMDLTITEFQVPNNKVLVFGDNRGNSTDSRVFGFIDESEIIGKVLFRFYPFTKIGNPSPDINR